MLAQSVVVVMLSSAVSGVAQGNLRDGNPREIQAGNATLAHEDEVEPTLSAVHCGGRFSKLIESKAPGCLAECARARICGVIQMVANTVQQKTMAGQQKKGAFQRIKASLQRKVCAAKKSVARLLSGTRRSRCGPVIGQASQSGFPKSLHELTERCGNMRSSVHAGIAQVANRTLKTNPVVTNLCGGGALAKRIERKAPGCLVQCAKARVCNSLRAMATAQHQPKSSIVRKVCNAVESVKRLLTSSRRAKCSPLISRAARFGFPSSVQQLMSRCQ